MMLHRTIKEKLLILGPFQLRVYMYCNFKGLIDTLERDNYLDASRAFQKFTQGFNQASERFLICDVGPGKDMADAKLRG